MNNVLRSLETNLAEQCARKSNEMLSEDLVHLVMTWSQLKCNVKMSRLVARKMKNL